MFLIVVVTLTFALFGMPVSCLGNLSVHIVFESRIQRISRITLAMDNVFDLGRKFSFSRIILFKCFSLMPSGAVEKECKK
jgi:hypothetical protein